jgi:hypothetical protein
MTGLTVGTASGNKDATEIWVGTASGNKQVTEGWIGTASGNKQFYSAVPPLSADASPNSQSWLVEDGPDIAKPHPDPDYFTYTAAIEATATGGQAPYTYAWEQLSGPSTSFFDATAAATNVSNLEGGLCTYRCTISDNLGTLAISDTITVHN